MTPTQEARDLVWLVLNASPRSNMDDLARGVQAIIDAAEERGKRMALEAAATLRRGLAGHREQSPPPSARSTSQHWEQSDE
jgi:hypothetical protein